VTLDGTGSADPDNAPAALTFEWSVMSVPATSTVTTANLIDAHTATPRFTPDVAGSYVIQLEVSDSVHTDVDTVFVTVGLPAIALTGQLTIEATAFEGFDVPVQFALTNNGTATADPVTVDIHVIELATGTIQVQLTETRTVNAGETVTGSQTIPPTLPLGDHLVVLRTTSAAGQQTVTTVVLKIVPAPDADGDGINDFDDACPTSDLSSAVVIDGCNSGALNQLFADGCTMTDEIAECATSVATHGDFVSCVSALTNGWKSQGIITGKEKGKIESCAARSDIPE